MKNFSIFLHPEYSNEEDSYFEPLQNYKLKEAVIWNMKM